ncbi:MAG: EAL domain-containing protein, partial [Thioalkalivibrio sp.]|nr:EAL domain-containing protein [Thioalkalivibrio sp.]
NAIVAMAQGLQMEIVVEGVETEMQLEYLRSLGCPVVQGFLYGQPDSLENVWRRATSRRREASAAGL